MSKFQKDLIRRFAQRENYEWKEWSLKPDSQFAWPIAWHIGGFSARDTGKALAELKHILSKDSYEVTK